VAELVDALVSGTSGESRGGSSPLLGTIEWNISVIFQLVIKTAKTKSHIQSHTLKRVVEFPVRRNISNSIVYRNATKIQGFSRRLDTLIWSRSTLQDHRNAPPIINMRGIPRDPYDIVFVGRRIAFAELPSLPETIESQCFG
jgi:hypothetical protein